MIAAARRLAASPWWLRVLLVFAASRVVTTAILLAFAAAQQATSFTGAHPSYVDFASIWDGRWYQIIAEQGYPAQLPRDADGTVTENAWAFLPAYAWLVRGLEIVTGLPFGVLAVAVSVVAAAVTALLLHRILVGRIGDAAATWSVALFCAAPLSPILQVGYAESMQLALVAGTILLVQRRRYLAAVPLIVVAGFTRPTGLAIGLFLLIHLVQRWRARDREPLPRGQLTGILVAGGVAAAVGVSWPVVAALVTGDPTAYTDTELYWRIGYIGKQDLIPFSPWFLGARFWLNFGLHVPEVPAAGLGGGIVVLLVVLLALLLLLPSARRLGAEPRQWVAAYGVYLLAVFFPQSSTFRLLMPMFPLLGAVQPRSWWVRGVLLAVGVAGQIGWCAICWHVDGYDWSPP